MKQRDIRRSISVALMVCALLTMLAPPGYSSSSAEGIVTTNLFIPFDGSVIVGTADQAETVDLTGIIHLVVKVSSRLQPQPPPIRVHANIISISGVGQTTGAIYKATGAASFDFDLDATNFYSFQAGYRLQPTPPPIIEGQPVPPPILPVQYSLTLNSLGEVLEATAVVGDNPVID